MSPAPQAGAPPACCTAKSKLNPILQIEQHKNLSVPAFRTAIFSSAGRSPPEHQVSVSTGKSSFERGSEATVSR